MKIDSRLVTGMLIGIAAGLHFTAQLAPYFTLVLVVGAFLLLRDYVK